MTKVLVSMGLASLLMVGALQGCGDDDSDSSGSAGSGTAGTSSGGSSSGGSGGSNAAGSSSGGSAGSASEDLYCGKKADELASISSCDAPGDNECVKAMCATTVAKDCKTILTDCVNDSGCNKSVACGANCRDPNNPDKNDDVVAVCTPLAGSGLSKALAYKGCVDKLTACGGDGSISPDPLSRTVT